MVLSSHHLDKCIKKGNLKMIKKFELFSVVYVLYLYIYMYICQIYIPVFLFYICIIFIYIYICKIYIPVFLF